MINNSNMSNNSKFKLAIVVLWNENIHGIIPENELPNEKQLSKYFMNDSSIDIKDFYDKQEYTDLNTYINSIKTRLTYNINKNVFGDYYSSIFTKMLDKNIIGLQIVENVEINEYKMCIIKTHFIKLIQRRWREIRKKRIQLKQNVYSLTYRQLYGTFPNTCNIPFKLGI